MPAQYLVMRALIQDELCSVCAFFSFKMVSFKSTIENYLLYVLVVSFTFSVSRWLRDQLTNESSTLFRSYLHVIFANNRYGKFRWELSWWRGLSLHRLVQSDLVHSKAILKVLVTDPHYFYLTMSMRKLKFHEEKLLKKVDFLNWKKDSSSKENAVLRRYHIQDRNDYAKYNKLVGQLTKLISKLKVLKTSDEYRIAKTEQLVNKLYEMGIINSRQGLSSVEKGAKVSTFCRRRLPVIMQRLKMAETVQDAVKYIEQGHVKVGIDTVTDPAFHVTRNMEDHITWVRSSAIGKAV